MWVMGFITVACGWSAWGRRFQQAAQDVDKVEYQYDIEKWLNNVDSDLSQFNSLAAHLTWKLSTFPDEKTSRQARQLGKVRNKWKNNVCESTIRHEWLTPEQRRKIYLLCRGPNFSDQMALEYLEVLGKMAQEFNDQVCLTGHPAKVNRTAPDFPKSGDCLYGEPDLERVMKRTDLDPEQLKWIWTNWHDSVGPRLKDKFRLAVEYQNAAAKNNGYNNIGEVWREELETPQLENFVFGLYEEVKPLYVLLHAVIRHKLLQKYGPSQIDPKGPIPMHLLGNMWGQDWTSLLEMFPLSPNKIDLDLNLRKKNRTVEEMVLEAEDFYRSLSLPKMTQKFWKYSIFEENENTTLCHGTAANLFSRDDFRMLMCGKVSMDDFYVIHHEMGHIEYYMAYRNQPAIFQDGTTTAVHESIGDAIMHGVMTPQHLHRLSVITDEQLLDNTTSLFLLFYQALSKIPEIPFSLILDKYRWDIFEGSVPYDQWNDYYWHLTRKFRGIVPPEQRKSELFDAGGKFHVPDNTPYIRYFLSGVIQMQVFRSLCELSLYGKIQNDSEEFYLPLHNCDIYGSKDGGKKLMTMMEKGASIRWPEALLLVTGTRHISAKPLLEYYKPVYTWLDKYVESNNVYVGW
ncbi:angiotensin-converting enzyme [Tribolium castaneum]|uniref:Angiotensin-converting enzyme n=1 Tax=Tribolium castaneum TaxID=7070 RepID=D6WRC2_TRICA|nr:PREDICTED: angiotensin-converting enzyme [Tribolium castaneum]EFA06546.2 Angiotensin-converting enzyme-like Protein [Tribolium castaneum]|eukprot:XP_972383.1 PREDICTED: angiotensin-converting enzyme [Tribolium castaneum]